MNFLSTVAISTVVLAQASLAQAAYRCELFDRAENAPGGDVPALVKFTDSNDFNAAKAACSGLVDKKNIVDFWLKWTDVRDLPTDWQNFNLLGTTQTQPTQPTQPTEAAKASGLACIIYNTRGDTPHYTYYAKDSFLKENKISLEGVVQMCENIMRSELPNQYRDYEVRYVEEVPANFSDIFDYEYGC
jgi:hypothetical protein